MSEKPEEKKVVIDEDWKSRVEAEKEAARKQAPTEPKAEPPGGPPPADEPDPPMPPPDLIFVAGTVYMQALIAMGLVANPLTGKAQQKPNQARHAIDTLQMLREKTEGNRTAEETGALDSMLHELRLAFVGLGKK